MDLSSMNSLSTDRGSGWIKRYGSPAGWEECYSRFFKLFQNKSSEIVPSIHLSWEQASESDNKKYACYHLGRKGIQDQHMIALLPAKDKR